METSKVYIKIDEFNRIIAIDGGYSIGNVGEDWILIDEGEGDRYNLCQNHYLSKPLINELGLHNYRWDGLKVIDRTEAELMAEMQAKELAEQDAEIPYEEKLKMFVESIPAEKPESGLPFKLGYVWKPRYNGNAYVWELVADPDAIGTMENPIYYVDDGSIPKINNAFYIIDGVRYVYMDGQFIEF